MLGLKPLMSIHLKQVMSHTKFTGTKATILIVILLATWGNNAQMAAADIFYPSTNYKVKGPPTYCTIVTNIDAPTSKVEEFVDISKNAVASWTNNLQAVEDGTKEIWKMSHKTVDHVQAGCDIMIQYKPHYGMSTQPASHDIIAGTFSSAGLIDIYYLQPFECDDGVLCYYDEEYKETASLYGTMLHEIGHSLGAGHYVSDEPDENKKWQNGEELPPSVMIPSIPQDATTFVIKDSDVQKIRQIYGQRGFYEYSDKEIPIFRPFVTIDVSSEKVVLNDASSNTVTISGQIEKNVLLDGHPIIISVLKPDQSVDVLKITHTRSGYFEVLTSYDKESALGLYTVSVSYLGIVDNEMDVYFKVADTAEERELSSSSPPSIANVIDLQKIAIKSLKQQAEDLKKAMAKIPKSSISEKDGYLIHALSDTVDFKIESAQLQVAKAEEGLNTSDYEAVIVALKDLDSSTSSALNTLKRISEIIEPYDTIKSSYDLGKIKSATKRMSAGLGDGSEFASAISEQIGTDIRFEQIPKWVITVSKWWSIELVSDTEYTNMLEYLTQNGILA